MIRPINGMSKFQSKKNVIFYIPIFDKTGLVIKNNEGKNFLKTKSQDFRQDFVNKVTHTNGTKI